MDPLQTIEPAPAPPRPTAAEACAGRNWEANRRALRVAQPDLMSEFVAKPLPPLEWVFGRDGSLTALDADGRWYAGCSLPARAGAAGLKSLDVRGTVACFLAPPHAGYVRVALDRMAANQALIAVLPDVATVAVLLRCEDFATDIAAHRLWFAWGARWADRLQQLLEARPGLPMPSQFVRLPHTDPELIQSLITASQRVFADVAAKRAADVRAVRESWARPAGPPRRVCVATASHFRLWDDAGFALADALARTAPAGVEFLAIDVDDPASAGPLALASAAAGCDAVVAADRSRADAPEVVHLEQPWVTWVTQPGRLPNRATAGPNDALLVADPSWRDVAVQGGWPADRVAVAAWERTKFTPSPGTPGEGGGEGPRAGHAAVERPAPTARNPHPNPLPEYRERESGAASRIEQAWTTASLTLIADTCPTFPLAAVEEFSSHRLLWETIRQELQADPFAVGDDPAAYLEAQVRKYGVSDEGLDRRRFVDGLIRPAFAQAVARLLIRAGMPVRLHGAGWETIEEFAAHAGGPVPDRPTLARAVATAAALVHAWPSRHAHHMDAMGRPVVRAADVSDAAELVWAARRALAATGAAPAGDSSPLSAGTMLRLLAPTPTPSMQA